MAVRKRKNQGRLFGERAKDRSDTGVQRCEERPKGGKFVPMCR